MSTRRKPRGGGEGGASRGRGGFERHGGPPREQYSDSGYASRGRGYGGPGAKAGEHARQAQAGAEQQAAPRGFDGKAVERYLSDKYEEAVRQRTDGSVKVLEDRPESGWGAVGGASSYFPLTKPYIDFLGEYRSQMQPNGQDPVAASD
eukprot:comp22075_c0_seq1/m.32169 comp22075_c0_seq1/g.32169  ORF comp22075_c0_seq1/g.32169 comp22075_c0_seq1/m.32169 type:complete len:148 (-) comp22075_c0_seq1:59-502(-)